MMRRSCGAIALAGLAVLQGCAAPQPPLYAWGRYQPALYDHLQGGKEGPEKQIALLEEDVEKARSKAGALPPGLNAHLGLLYLSTGRTEQAQKAWQAEKSLFPEAGAFMDFLLAKFKK
jgi:hypothetical protein